MHRGRFVLALLLLTPPARAQVTITAPGVPPPGGAARPSDANYGPPRLVELEALLLGDGYQRAHVITEGEVSPFENGRYWTLGHATARVLLIPSHDFDPSELDRVVGRRTEVRGIVRLIREKQYLGPSGKDLDLVEDPLLPVLPPPQFERGWPRISITVFAIRDRTNPETTRSKEVGGGVGWQILQEPAAYLGKKTKIYGQFRGRNLFGDLPAGSARSKDDWVLKDGDTAIWVMGKTPKGEGWKLDPEYKGDSKNWLEVEGKAEVLNGVVYLKASKVLMSKAPGKEKPEPPSR
jgi:hypothetical protein